MVFRINRFHILIFVLCFVSVLLVFAVKAETTNNVRCSSEGIRLPVVMYHHITEKDSRAGKYIIKVSELTNDLDYIKSQGYHTVTVKDIVDYVDGKKALPEKVIMITFDDGFESVYRYAGPLLKERKMCAVISPIGSVTDTYTKNGDQNINYSYMTWQELAAADASDEFEIQNHTYDMHYTSKAGRKGLSRMNGESAEKYKAVLKEDLEKMQQLLKSNSSVTALAAVYPYGVYSKETHSVVKQLGFRCSMLCEERVNRIIPGNHDSLFNLGRFNRPSGISTESFFEKLM